MFTDAFESSGGWVVLLIVGIAVLIAAVLALAMRMSRRPPTAPLPKSRPSDAPTPPAPGNPAQRPADPAPRAPPRTLPTANRPEGIGAASQPHSHRDLRKYDRQRPTAAIQDAPPAPPSTPPQSGTGTSPEILDHSLPRPAAQPGAPVTGPSVGEDKGDYVAVTVHYGTDRHDLGDNPADPGARYNYERADLSDGRPAIAYGTCAVSIPKSHSVGGLEDRTWWQWATLQGRTPDKHVMVVKLTAEAPEVFFTDLASVVARSSKKDAFVFVHGFSVSFADAARRTAQMAYDLKFEGAPIFFSWPTPDLTTSLFTAYTTSESNAGLSKHRLRSFLQDVLEKSGASTVHIIAHSMGNRLVTDALQMLDSVSTAHLKPLIGEVILTAPDIDATEFTTVIAPRLTSFLPRVTLYASTKDKALEASQSVHSFPRIGEFQSLVSIPQGVEVIDASSVYDSADSLGHSYYGDSEPVIGDLCYLLSLGERAAGRSLTLAAAKTSGDAACWSVVKRPLADVYAAIAERRQQLTS